MHAQHAVRIPDCDRRVQDSFEILPHEEMGIWRLVFASDFVNLLGKVCRESPVSAMPFAFERP
jgi:hypothetical protein